MKVTFWGVRGSIPAPGPETNRYGGNTSCTHVRLHSGRDVIIDMGTGLMRLGQALLAQESFRTGKGEATILLSHSHWDHIQGFPFFAPVFIPGNRFDIYGNAGSSGVLEGILEGQMNPNFSPIYTLKNLGAAISFHPLVDGAEVELSGATLSGFQNPHGRSTSLAFRICDQGKTFIYASDVGYPKGGPGDDVLSFYRGADLLIHDSTYTPKDRAERLERGLSSYEDAADVAIRAEVGHLVLFHYDQDYSDDMVDDMVARCREILDSRGGSKIEVSGARERTEISV